MPHMTATEQQEDGEEEERAKNGSTDVLTPGCSSTRLLSAPSGVEPQIAPLLQSKNRKARLVAGQL